MSLLCFPVHLYIMIIMILYLWSFVFFAGLLDVFFKTKAKQNKTNFNMEKHSRKSKVDYAIWLSSISINFLLYELAQS